jgi:hypothetical protein
MSVGSSSSGGEFQPSNAAGSFSDVARRVVTQPVEFFRGMVRGGSFVPPLVFALICFVINAFFSGLFLLFGAVPGGGAFSRGGQVDAVDGIAAFLGNLILEPILGIIGLFIWAGILYLLIRAFVGANNQGYISTFKVVAYSSVVALVSWIPLIGFLATLYGLYLTFVGVREAHATDSRNAGLVVGIPVAVLILLGLLGLFGALIAAFAR